MLARSDPWRLSDRRLLPHPSPANGYNFFSLTSEGVKKVGLSHAGSAPF